MESLWSQVATSYSPPVIEFTGTLIVQVISFWIPCAFYIALDFAFPSFSQRHKIQSSSRQPTARDIWQCLQVVLANQVLSTGIHLFLLFVIKRGQSSYRVQASIPSLPEIARDVALSLLLREALFYYSHRFLHRPYFYTRIHKKHHRFTAPIALSAQYAHPIEQIFANTLPISLPPQILGAHVVTFWIFLAYELFNTATVHSGYDFFKAKAKMHDLHHEKFNLNYGSIGLLDWFHGTNKPHKKEKFRE